MPDVPVLLLIFNRPDTTRRVLQALRTAAPPRVYVAADGPRPSRPGEVEACLEARSVVDEIDWTQEIQTLYRNVNLGCRRAVSSGIDWFFEHEERGVILEDDCLPDASFFPFCEELLERYDDEPRVLGISGDNFLPSKQGLDPSYTFSRYCHVWGWATWRRAWMTNDAAMESWPELRRTDWLLRLGDGDPYFAAYWAEQFDAVFTGRLDTWDYVWNYSAWRAGGLFATPLRNLVSNIGFGPSATHTRSMTSPFGHLPIERMPFPLRHPSAVEHDTQGDRWKDIHHYRMRSPSRRALARVPSSLRPRARNAAVAVHRFFHRGS
jgi:hypothetical protein